MIVTGLALVFVSLVFIYKHRTWRALPWPPGALRPAKFQAHRGHWRGGLQENTVDAFRKAKNLGFEMIEMDVQLSQDNVPVIFHDRDLQRLGQRAEQVRVVGSQNLKTWAQIAPLMEVLQDPQAPNFINIELKSGDIFDQGLERAVAGIVRECGAEDRVLFSSFNPLSLLRIKKQLPAVPRALLATQEDDPANKIYLRQMWLAPYIGIHLLHLDGRYIHPDDIRAWKRRGVPVAVWTVNDAKSAQAFLEAGAISIITDLELAEIQSEGSKN